VKRKLETRLFFAKPKFCQTVMDIAVRAFPATPLPFPVEHLPLTHLMRGRAGSQDSEGRDA